MNLKRLLRHLVTDHWTVRRAFPSRAMQAIESAIAGQERRHTGELRFAVEAALPLRYLLSGGTSRGRAIEHFARLRIWDTEHNCGVLIYLVLADRQVEIVADRGIHARVGDTAWVSICDAMRREFRQGRFEQGVVAGVQAIGDLLAAHFPAGKDAKLNELSDKPVVI